MSERLVRLRHVRDGLVGDNRQMYRTNAMYKAQIDLLTQYTVALADTLLQPAEALERLTEERIEEISRTTRWTTSIPLSSLGDVFDPKGGGPDRD